MLRRPIVFGHEIAIEGDDLDLYVRDLPDGEPFSDDVLSFLGSLDNGHDPLTVLDVGANVGVHSIGLASRGSHVHVVAVEANPRTGALLRANVERNGACRVRVVDRAAGEEPGTLVFCDNQDFAAGSMPLLGAPTEFVDFLRAEGATRRAVIEVAATPLDDLVAELGLTTVDVIKIDVEGHDIRVIRGAQRILDRFRPVVVMEFATLAISLHAGLLPSGVLHEVRTRFRDVYVVREGGFLSPIADDAAAIAFLHDNAVGTPVQDLVCVPEGCALAEVVRRRVVERPPPTRTDRIRELEEKLRQERAARERLAEELDEARRHARNLEQTVSWRVTRPLRAIRRRLG